MADGSVKIKIEAEDSGVAEELKDVGESADDAAKGLDNMGDSANDAGQGLSVADVAAGNLAANGVSTLISALGNAVNSLISLADSTREYREDMAKLETAFTTAGHSSETASKAYEDFYALLGESDRAVEATNHLAELTQREKDISNWSTIAAGVMARFGDSLPIEGLTEAANETAKVGQVTGPLADALNWAGISEEKFNEQLAKCSNAQERATLITNTLAREYSAAADEYNELTASTQDARRATSEMEQTQAALGEAIEPVTTAWTRLKSEALQAFVPMIQSVGEAFQELSAWMEENPGKAAVLKAAVIGLAVAFGVLAAALAISALINMVTTAFTAMSAVLAANPIIWIVAAIAGLVVAFIYLLSECEAVGEFFSGLWDSISSGAAGLGESISGAFSSASDGIKSAWSSTKGFFADMWEGIKSAFSAVGEFFTDAFQAASDGIKSAWSSVKGFFADMWEGIKNAFSAVGEFFTDAFQAASDGIKSAWSSVKGFFADMWEGIKNAFSAVGEFFTDAFQAASDGIKSAWSSIKDFFTDVWDGIKNAFSAVGEFFSSAFQSAYTGVQNIWASAKEFFGNIWTSIRSVFAQVGEFFTNAFNSAYTGITNIFSRLSGFFSDLWSSITSVFTYGTDRCPQRPAHEP